MEKQRWEESERRRAKERRSEKRKSEKKEDAGVRKGSKVAKHCGQMRDEKLHAVGARSTFPSQNVQSTSFSDHFWKLRC